MPIALLVFNPSVKAKPGSWHVAQDTSPFELNLSSKKRWWPSVRASFLSATRFVGSVGGDSGRFSIQSELIWSSSADDH